ncbi:hypothetical protein B0H63DRAFT_522030 [Podospora didyma]|uniref:Zn(2)-C6 fungal-type domain-containing protein n=1 Tax=Podospora didyma TaxID=330526 RepID=A0AAE0U220_9PEZI|nr:hypothetical protein B0H63DRAFT_522030 [Podospora didyma]
MDSSRVVLPSKRRACVACTTAKSKCTPLSTNICERCSRLGKRCIYLDMPERRRHNQSRGNASSSSNRRVDALESKIDGLLEQISILTGQRKPDHCELSRTPPTLNPTPAATSSASSQSVDHQHDGVLSVGFHAGGLGAGDIIDRGLITLEHARTLVASFKQDFVPYFPFVALGATDSADYVRKDSPFLFLCIAAITSSSDLALQVELGEEICRQVSSRLIMGAQRSLDLLRGLLIYSAWYHYFAWSGHAQIFMFVQLCVTVVHDLDFQKRGDLVQDDEKRAFLGAFWLSVSVSRAIQKPLGMRYTSIIDDWSLELTSNPHHPTDTSIRPFMLLQSLVYRVLDTYISAASEGTKSPSTYRAVAFAFLCQLAQLKAEVERDLPKCEPLVVTLISMDMLYTESWLQDIALEGDLWFYYDPCNPPTIVTDMPLPQRTALLWKRVANNKLFLKRLQEIPKLALPHMVYETYAWICAIQALHTRAASRLLQDVVERSNDATSEGQCDDNFHRFEVQMVVNAVDFSATLKSLLSAFETASGRETGNNMGYEETEVGRLLRGLKGQANQFATHIHKLTGDAGLIENTGGTEVSLAVTANDTVSVPHLNNVGGNHEGPDGGWPSMTLGMGEDLGMIVPDEEFWNSIMNDFSQSW